MSDEKPATEPGDGTAHQEPVPPQQTVSTTPPGETTPRQRFTDRLWGFRAVIAVALASVIIGGLGGAALASLGGRHDDGRSGPGFGHHFRGGPGQQGRGPNGFGPPGQMKKDRGQGHDRGQRGENDDNS